MSDLRHPSSTVERDLCNLVGERVRKAVMSVVQVAEDEKQAFVIACTAEAAVSGILAGTYCAMTGTPREAVNPIDVAVTVLLSSKEALAGAS